MRLWGRRVGAVLAASTALATAYVGAQEVTGQLPAAEAAQETGGYPWANAPIGSLDDLGLAARECESYVVWKLRQQGVATERAYIGSTASIARQQFETVNATPAAGAMASYDIPGVTPGHSQYVEAVDIANDTITVSDYNGWGGLYSYGYTTVELSRYHWGLNNLSFIHYELPPVANGAFIGARYDRRNGDSLKSRGSTELGQGEYLKSANGRYVLLLDKTGNLALYDKDNDFAKRWQSDTKFGIEVQAYLIVNKKTGNRLTIENARTEKKMKAWNIGQATRVKVTNAGKLAGFKGKKKLWTANDLRQMHKKGQQAIRKLRKQQARKRKLAKKQAKAKRGTGPGSLRIGLPVG